MQSIPYQAPASVRVLAGGTDLPVQLSGRVARGTTGAVLDTAAEMNGVNGAAVNGGAR